MALKALLLGNELKCKRKALAAMDTRAQELHEREEQLTAAIDEVETRSEEHTSELQSRI